ncbi:MAG: hypothetical protein LBJ62_07615 [Bifidobacteriaceae bacterium]|nr:hypothetical protein [Bifidobacteriaceae bacterium]
MAAGRLRISLAALASWMVRHKDKDMKRFARAFLNLVSSAGRASSVVMERGAERLTEYAEKHRPDPPKAATPPASTAPLATAPPATAPPAED